MGNLKTTMKITRASLLREGGLYAGGGTRTRTPKQAILSRWCLPFHHISRAETVYHIGGDASNGEGAAGGKRLQAVAEALLQEGELCLARAVTGVIYGILLG